MSVTLDDIAVELGRATPATGTVEARQWDMWIGDALALIEARATRLGVPFEALPQETLGRVVRLAVAAHAQRPDNSTQVDVAIDDGRVSRRYSSSAGRVAIDEDWWADLGLSLAAGAWTHEAGPRGPRSYMWTGPDTWVPLP